MSYYSSAEEMAGDLSLGVLLCTDPDPRVLRRHDRLSGYATDPAHGARFYNLLRSAMTRQGAEAGLAGRVIWIAAPSGSLHHLPWVIGLSEHAARDGLIALLADCEESGPLTMLAEGGGRLIEGLSCPGEAAAGPLQACSTDLEGVSVVRRGSGEEASQSLRLESRPWCLLRADALPEVLEGPYPQAAGIDGIILVAPFRDHSREELTAIVRGLRSAGHRIFGLVAIGPKAQAGGPPAAGSPPPAANPRIVAENGTGARPEKPAKPDKPGEPDEPGEPASPDAGTLSDPVPVVSSETSDPAPLDDTGGPTSVPLIASWDRRARSRRSRWPAALLITALIFAVPAAFFLRDHLSRPSQPVVDTGEPASPVTPARDNDPWSSQLVPMALEIAGEDVLGPPGHDDTYWDFLDGMGPMEAQGPEQMDPGFGVAHPAGAGEDDDDADQERKGFVLHLSSFRLRSEADREIANLAGLGVDARHVAVVIPGRGLRPWYRVVTGLSATFAGAESLALHLMTEGKIPSAHIAGRGGHGDPVPVAFPD